nr:hypothetical protein [Tanacetum cinerariifolium]GFC19557.1 hypothetical protein [Tanacetum cinerariifolium]
FSAKVDSLADAFRDLDPIVDLPALLVAVSDRALTDLGSLPFLRLFDPRSGPVAMTKTQQLKLVTKRSRQQTHISQPSGLGSDEGTSSKPGVPDVPTNDSEEELSCNSTNDEGDDNEEKDDDGDEDNEGDDGEEGNGNDDNDDKDDDGDEGEEGDDNDADQEVVRDDDKDDVEESEDDEEEG